MEHMDEVLEQLKEPMLETLKKWISTPSIKGEACENAPFGTDCRKMLDVALDTCKELGFAVKDVDGYAGHAEMGEGSDEDALAILAHLDVVPVGDGWTVEPFGALVKDGKMYGRGTSDDKGPAVAALYAMKAVQMAGIPLARKVRLILGCDEESGWQDIAYYKAHETMPKRGFSPDADYPVINIEKGASKIELRAKNDSKALRVLSFSTGERVNVIPGQATATVAGDEKLAERINGTDFGYPVDAAYENGTVRIHTVGIPGHAAMPTGTRNAIGQMLLVFKSLGVDGSLRTLADAIGMEHDGHSMGVKICDEVSGELTCNMGIIRVDETSVYATLDIRMPILTNGDEMVKSIVAHLPDIQVTEKSRTAPHNVPENSDLVQKLLDAYHEVTGRERKALAIGGGTYAKTLEEGVAFGILLPDEKEMAHQADEYVTLSNLTDSVKIFAKAIVKLAAKQ